MQGSPNAERLMKTVKKYFSIDKDNHNLAYSICMNMKIVYANEIEEGKVLFEELRAKGFEALAKKRSKK